MNRVRMPLLLLVAMAIAIPATAQDKSKSKKNDPGHNKSENNQTTEFVDMYNARHRNQKPTLGDALDEVLLYDAKGNKFSTKQLRGKHTVLVFGCIT